MAWTDPKNPGDKITVEEWNEHVDHHIFIANSISGTPGYIPYWQSNNKLAPTNMFFFNNKIGINKTDPQYDLDVNGSINASSILINGSPIISDISVESPLSITKNFQTNSATISLNYSSEDFEVSSGQLALKTRFPNLVQIGGQSPNGKFKIPKLNINHKGIVTDYEEIEINANGTNLFTQSGDNLGLGTADPIARLHINSSDVAFVISSSSISSQKYFSASVSFSSALYSPYIKVSLGDLLNQSQINVKNIAIATDHNNNKIRFFWNPSKPLTSSELFINPSFVSPGLVTFKIHFDFNQEPNDVFSNYNKSIKILNEPNQYVTRNLMVYHQGVLKGIGDNLYGSLGFGDTSPRTTLTQIPFSYDVKRAWIGYWHSIIETTNGDIYCSGRNDYGQLGLGDTTNRTTFTLNSTLSNLNKTIGIKMISLGLTHSLVLLNNGEVYSFGQNSSGALGLGHTNNTSTPTKIPTLSNITKIYAADQTSAFLTNNGTLFICGIGTDYATGLNTTSNTTSPTQLLSGVKDFLLTYHAGVALFFDGTIRVWGDSSYYQTGMNTTSDYATPQVNTYLVNNKITSIYSNNTAVFAFDEFGNVFVFGGNSNYALGLGTTSNVTVPTIHPFLKLFPNNIIKFISFEHGAMFVLEDGSFICSGGNYSGTYLLGHSNYVMYPTKNTSYVSVPNIQEHAAVLDCALTDVESTISDVTFLVNPKTKSISINSPHFYENTLYVNGPIFANNYFSTSDISIKENIEPISEEEIKKLLSINPIEYVDVESKEKRFGLLAQEIEELFPNIVKQIGEYKTIDYLELIPIIIAAIKKYGDPDE
ncbi:MAG: tail fiber domain-containing protein [Thermoplasmata archaeon]